MWSSLFESLGVGTKSLLTCAETPTLLYSSRIKSKPPPKAKFVGRLLSEPVSSYLSFGPMLEMLKPNL